MPRERVVVRTASERDAVGLARIFTDAFGPTSPADVRRGMRRRDSPQEYLLGVVDGVPAATLVIQYRELLVDGARIQTGGIAGVATRWEYRRRGLATRLMREAIRRVRARGISNTTLFTARSLPAIRIYERLGYSETAHWRIFFDVRRPVAWVARRFAYRARWLRRTAFGRDVLKGWRARVLLATPTWRATITFDGRRFTVRPGRRGRPDITMRGGSEAVLDSFGNRLAYDRNVRAERISVRGEPDALSAWRRLLTLEWRE